MAVGSMTKAERDAFLADVHVGILAVDEPGRGPLALPIWYRYVDGVVVIGMDGDSLKARLLRAAGRATLTVQTEAPPYLYASVEGPVRVVVGAPRRSRDGDALSRAGVGRLVRRAQPEHRRVGRRRTHPGALAHDGLRQGDGGGLTPTAGAAERQFGDDAR